MSETHYSTGFIGFGFVDNVNGLELTQTERRDFTADLTQGLFELGADVLFVGEGTGQWEGQSEPAGSITFRLPINHLITVRKESLRALLAAAAHKYDQDCIAVTYGDSVLVDAAAPVLVDVVD